MLDWPMTLRVLQGNSDFPWYDTLHEPQLIYWANDGGDYRPKLDQQYNRHQVDSAVRAGGLALQDVRDIVSSEISRVRQDVNALAARTDNALLTVSTAMQAMGSSLTQLTMDIGQIRASSAAMISAHMAGHEAQTARLKVEVGELQLKALTAGTPEHAEAAAQLLQLRREALGFSQAHADAIGASRAALTQSPLPLPAPPPATSPISVAPQQQQAQPQQQVAPVPAPQPLAPQPAEQPVQPAPQTPARRQPRDQPPHLQGQPMAQQLPTPQTPGMRTRVPSSPATPTLLNMHRHAGPRGTAAAQESHPNRTRNDELMYARRKRQSDGHQKDPNTPAESGSGQSDAMMEDEDEDSGLVIPGLQNYTDPNAGFRQKSVASVLGEGADFAQTTAPMEQDA